jgi:hypothetical protein
MSKPGDPVKDAAKEIQDQAAVDAKGPVAGEVDPKAEAKEAEKVALDQSALNDLGRIEETRVILARAYETYRHSIDGALHRLHGHATGAGHSEVKKTAKAVADAYDLKLDTRGLTQPPAPKVSK